MKQGSLFSEDLPYEGDDGYVCIKCDVYQPKSHFQVMEAGEVKRTCKSCANKLSQVRRRLALENPYPTDPNYCCPVCDRTIEEIDKYDQKVTKRFVLDHCHETETFRGWVCTRCNTGIGGLQDSVTIIKRALAYLEEHENFNT